MVSRFCLSDVMAGPAVQTSRVREGRGAPRNQNNTGIPFIFLLKVNWGSYATLNVSNQTPPWSLFHRGVPLPLLVPISQRERLRPREEQPKVAWQVTRILFLRTDYTICATQCKVTIWVLIQESRDGGAPGWRSRLSVRLQPGHHLAVREIEPRVRL